PPPRAGPAPRRQRRPCVRRRGATRTRPDRRVRGTGRRRRAGPPVGVGPHDGHGRSPRAHRCPRGDECFAEAARARAAEADVVIVNQHLYGLDLASDGAILPDHDIAIIAEAPPAADIAPAPAGAELPSGRFAPLARTLRGILADAGDTITRVGDAGGLLT